MIKKMYLFFTLTVLLPEFLWAQQIIRVGAKHFNEGYILSELISQTLENKGFYVERKFNLGGTAIAFDALRTGNIDVYPEYSGTIANEILKATDTLSIEQLKIAVKNAFNLNISNTYGFNNTYALVVTRDKAARWGLNAISDLSNHPDLTAGLSHEFINRKDGWQNLAATYQLKNTVKGIEHGLAYKALLSGDIEITDAYSTDGEIVNLQLRVLKDDKTFFPHYQALSFYSSALSSEAIQALSVLEGMISEKEMQEMNAEVLYKKRNFYDVAHAFLISKKIISDQTTSHEKNNVYDFLLHVWQHLMLTLISIIVAITIALPLGIYLHNKKRLLQPLLFVTSILQTIPSIALLALFIPLLGIGKLPALIALCLYALLPILRNTVTGLQNVNPDLLFVAEAIGLNQKQILRKVKLPLSMPSIMSGIRIASVINVGTATLAAFIGAGGLGEYIVTGLALNDTVLILKGALPSALLAILIELLFNAMERKRKRAIGL
ncbi:MAG: ABC transporter permease subunit [Chitinophagaceae bacterium]|jgi:osmoprotectant transport system permease protein|nr:ABC transporter permease subunit [Chitinophagaceae bacterium]